MNHGVWTCGGVVGRIIGNLTFGNRDERVSHEPRPFQEWSVWKGMRLGWPNATILDWNAKRRCCRGGDRVS